MTTEIVLVRQEQRAIDPNDAAIARRVLFSFIDGLNEVDKRAWRTTVNSWFKLEVGEMAGISVTVERYGPYHKRHMALERKVFEAQEPFHDFRTGFRDFLKVGAGHVEWSTDKEGVMQAKPKSTSYRLMDDIQMREYSAAVVSFLRSQRALATLWPHITPRAREEMIEGLLRDR
jgi:hypothetical protein